MHTVLGDRIGSVGRLKLAATTFALAGGLLLWQAPPSLAGSVSYPDFSSVAGLTLNGSASVSNNLLELTPALSDQAGSAFTDKRVVNPANSFETSFEFHLYGGNRPGGDGIAFVIQTVGRTALGGSGEGIGYSGISPSVEVEFDKFGGTNDPTTNEHVAIMKNGDDSNHLAWATPAFDLKGSPPRFAWIDYSAARHRLKVYVSKTSKQPASPLVSHKINVNAILGGHAFAGFTGGTGGRFEAQDILKWKLTNP